MPASVTETILARVAAVLANEAETVARARDDAFTDEELPALNIRRGDTSGEPMGDNGQREYVEWEIQHHVAAAALETAADALHMAVHAALFADTTLAGLGRGLRCLSTSLQTDSSDKPRATLTARYRMHVFVRPGDLTRAIN